MTTTRRPKTSYQMNRDITRAAGKRNKSYVIPRTPRSEDRVEDINGIEERKLSVHLDGLDKIRRTREKELLKDQRRFFKDQVFGKGKSPGLLRAKTAVPFERHGPWKAWHGSSETINSDYVNMYGDVGPRKTSFSRLRKLSASSECLLECSDVEHLDIDDRYFRRRSSTIGGTQGTEMKRYVAKMKENRSKSTRDDKTDVAESKRPSTAGHKSFMRQRSGTWSGPSSNQGDIENDNIKDRSKTDTNRGGTADGKNSEKPKPCNHLTGRIKSETSSETYSPRRRAATVAAPDLSKLKIDRSKYKTKEENENSPRLSRRRKISRSFNGLTDIDPALRDLRQRNGSTGSICLSRKGRTGSMGEISTTSTPSPDRHSQTVFEDILYFSLTGKSRSKSGVVQRSRSGSFTSSGGDDSPSDSHENLVRDLTTTLPPDLHDQLAKTARDMPLHAFETMAERRALLVEDNKSKTPCNVMADSRFVNLEKALKNMK